MKRKFLILIFINLICFLQCESGVTPKKVINIDEYQWQLDTIKTSGTPPFQLLMRSIWGSDPENIYTCGHTSSGPELFHFNGSTWSDIDFFEDWNFLQNVKNFVFGLGQHDVWVAGAQGYGGGYKPVISHFNGSVWNATEFEIEGELKFIWGSNSNNLWASGQNGLVINKTNNEWIIDTIKIDYSHDDVYNVMNIYELGARIFAFGYKVSGSGNGINYYHFERVSNNWIVLDSFSTRDNLEIYKWGDIGIQYFNGSIYSNGRNGVYKFVKNNWENIFSSFQVTAMLIISDDQFLISDNDGHIYYVNHGSYKELIELHLSDVFYTDFIMIEENIFIIGWEDFNTYSGTIMWQGK